MSSASDVLISWKPKQHNLLAYTLTVENRGNERRFGYLRFEKPENWVCRLSDGTSEKEVVLPRRDSQSFEVTVSAPNAKPGKYTLTAKVSASESSTGTPIAYGNQDVPVPVEGTLSFTLTRDHDEPTGDTSKVPVEVSNGTNADVNVVVPADAGYRLESVPPKLKPGERSVSGFLVVERQAGTDEPRTVTVRLKATAERVNMDDAETLLVNPQTLTITWPRLLPPVTITDKSHSIQAGSGKPANVAFHLKNNRTDPLRGVVVSARFAGSPDVAGRWQGDLDLEADGQLSLTAPALAGSYRVEVKVDSPESNSYAVTLVVPLDQSEAPVLNVTTPSGPVPIGQAPDCELTVMNPSNAPLQGKVSVGLADPGSTLSGVTTLQRPIDPNNSSPGIRLPVEARNDPGVVKFRAVLEPQFLRVNEPPVDASTVQKDFMVAWERPFPWPAIRLDAWVSVPSTAGDPTGQVGSNGSEQFVAYRGSDQYIRWNLIVNGSVIPNDEPLSNGLKSVPGASPSLFRLAGKDTYNLFLVYRCEPGFESWRRDFNLASYKWNREKKEWEPNAIPWAVDDQGKKFEKDNWFIRPVAGDPAGVTFQADGYSRHVVYRDDRDDLRDVVFRAAWYNQSTSGGGWGQFIPTVKSGVPKAAGGPTAYAGRDGQSIHVVYRGKDDGQAHLLSHRAADLSWAYTPLPTQGGGEPHPHARFSAEARQGPHHIVYRDTQNQVQLLLSTGNPEDKQGWRRIGPGNGAPWTGRSDAGTDPAVFAPTNDGPVFVAIPSQSGPLYLFGYVPDPATDPSQWTTKVGQLPPEAPPAKGAAQAFGAEAERFLTYRAADRIVVVRFG